MKKILVVLSLFILIGCETIPPTEAKVKTVKDKVDYKIGVMTVSCKDLNAILDLSQADRESLQAVQIKLQQYILLGKCGVHNPRIAVPLETLIDEYVDFMGVESQIWKVKNIQLWTLIAKNIIYHGRPKDKSKSI